MQEKQQIVILDKSSVEIDHVSSVKYFDESGVLLDSPYGKIEIEGRNLKIENFEKSNSKIFISGNVLSVMYVEKADKKKGRMQFK